MASKTLLRALSAFLLVGSGLSASTPDAGRTCTLQARGPGKDDTPAFVSLARDASCSTVVVPQHTTLNLSTKVDMTGLKNKHIV